MTHTTETVVDRYIALIDRAVDEPAVLEELGSFFAADAIVQLEDFEPVTGLPAITEFYRRFYSNAGEGKHFWNTTVLDDGRLEVRFLVAGRTPDGQLTARSGIEHATVNTDGLITYLTAKAVALDV
ncbi:nuclear transport factor 2 family protein [Streptomyces doebereineriae]|uniref:Nuclear transport factor 2 family protein n=1 Tax=Streptomyces doebereineriae TaxID=3075528 RepID=A0ABU2VJL8_9ACTN|nr:nuclear transport factor 2 family protein [Streptomyces sp. DSM 41640]MDT0485409.1 nuclear transport factor 2 family protein [Streptomyces sp. DSM 41640]